MLMFQGDEFALVGYSSQRIVELFFHGYCFNEGEAFQILDELLWSGFSSSGPLPFEWNEFISQVL